MNFGYYLRSKHNRMSISKTMKLQSLWAVKANTYHLQFLVFGDRNVPQTSIPAPIIVMLSARILLECSHHKPTDGL